MNQSFIQIQNQSILSIFNFGQERNFQGWVENREFSIYVRVIRFFLQIRDLF